MTSVRVLGCSDAFSSGGRLFPAFHVESASARFLIDCGPTALLAMKRSGLDPDALDAVLISHFHGDHIGGLPFLELELGIMRKRSRALALGGPPGIEQRMLDLVAVMYPSLEPTQRVRYEYTEWIPGASVEVGPVRVTSAEVVHTPESVPHALRIELDDCTIAYSGDTEWTDELIAIAAGADLFICEATTYSTPVENHLSYETLIANRARIDCERLVITHMSEEMLQRLPVEGVVGAVDGLVVRL